MHINLNVYVRVCICVRVGMGIGGCALLHQCLNGARSSDGNWVKGKQISKRKRRGVRPRDTDITIFSAGSKSVVGMGGETCLAPTHIFCMYT